MTPETSSHPYRNDPRWRRCQATYAAYGMYLISLEYRGEPGVPMSLEEAISSVLQADSHPETGGTPR